jgi:hypothetical protein
MVAAFVILGTQLTYPPGFSGSEAILLLLRKNGKKNRS